MVQSFERRTTQRRAMCGIIHRTAVRRKLWKRFVPLSEHETHIPDVFRHYEITPERMRLLRALSRISAKQRAAFLLFELAGFSLQEIQVIQGDKSLSAVKSRLQRTRRQLRDLLQADTNGHASAPIVDTVSHLEKETIRNTTEALETLNER